jgi:hypothetical protein
VALSGPARTPLSNTTNPRTKKHSKKRRLSQLATWVEDPIVFKVRKKARAKDLSMSAALREIILTGLKDEGSADEALEKASLRESHARDIRALGSRLAFLLVWLIYDVGYIKLLSSSTLGMQKDMTPELLKDIFHQADRKTTAALSRKRPELTPLVKAVEQWLTAGEEETAARTPRNGKPGKGSGA